jgi:predicted CXXCH cytochrome family protein
MAGLRAHEPFEQTRIRMPGAERNCCQRRASTEIYFEVHGLATKLYAAIQAYAAEKSGAPICYDGQSYPYFFANPSGALGPCAFAETATPTAYKSWSPRLLRAAYNYQLVQKDPGGFAHNARYLIELLYDSIQDLNAALTAPVDMSAAHRNAPGHFNGSSEAARYWDEDEALSANCSKCHGGSEGFRFYQKHGVGTELLETANGLECDTCHASVGPQFSLLPVESTTYPSGVQLAHGGADNLCATCHSGRESKASIDASTAAGRLSFRNVHHQPAAAVLNGNTAQVGYEYADKSYAGPLKHANRTQCNGCHDAKLSQHSFAIKDVWQPVCRTCHANEPEAEFVRIVRKADYDGDGSVTETLIEELDGLRTIVLGSMREVAVPTICYESSKYPYWFVDRSGSLDGICVSEDAERTNQFNTWTPALMKAAHNYQIVTKDPGPTRTTSITPRSFSLMQPKIWAPMSRH